MRRLRSAVVAVVIAGALAATLAGASHAQVGMQSEGGWRGGDPPPGAGVHLAVWNGGTVEQAAGTPGLRSLWVVSGGEFVGYLVGAPRAVNQSFRARFADGTIPAGTPAILVLTEGDALETPEAVVRSFLAALDESAPPAGSEAGFVRALARLTEQTRARMTSPGALAAFLGVQDLPDVGVSIRERERDEEQSRVVASLVYSGGTAEREFLLLRERQRWLIAWVDAFPVTADSPPADVAESFLMHFVASAPPAASPYPAERAASLLSDEAGAALEPGLPLASALAAFVGVQDVPD